MDTQNKFDLITKNTEEVLVKEELQRVLETGEKLRHYIGFEISGKIHLGTGLMSMGKVKDFLAAGVECSVFLADWHTWINDKLGGDPEVIKKVAVGYFKEGMKASMKCVGGDPEKIKYVLGTELYHNNDEYWQTVVDVAKNISLARAMRSITIMGRKEGESVDFAKLLYPAMQVADIFAQGVNISHAGMDQRKAHVVAREVALKLKIKPLLTKKKEIYSPIAVHHPLILGLQKPAGIVTKENLKDVLSEVKMSKSIPNSAVFIHDSPEEIKKKILGAYCEAGNIDYNPLTEWTKHLILSREKGKLDIKRPEKFGGDITYYTANELERDFAEKKLHPMDLKNAVVESLVKILEPARKHFEQAKVKKMKEEMESIVITR